MSDRPDHLHRAKSEPTGPGGTAHEGSRPERTVRVVIGSNLDDLVAVKTGSNPAAVVAIEREALVLSQVRHPNVVDLLRTERGEGTATLVTQFAGRTTLAQLQPVDATTVARIGASLLTVVGELHTMGWVHGRLSEEHCIVGSGGRLTLCAFGAAHRVEAGDDRRLAEVIDAVGIVGSLADRLAEPTDRPSRKRHRRLVSLLAVDTTSLSLRDAEEMRLALAELGGAAPARSAPGAEPPSEEDRAVTRPVARPPRPARSRDGDTTRPARTSVRPRRWKGVVASAGMLVILLGAVAFLRWLGGPLGNSLTTSGVRRIGDIPAPVALALSIVRIVAFAACLYGIVLATATLAAVLTRRPDIERLATAMAPPRLRRVLVALIGLGVLSSGASGAAPGPTSTVTVASAVVIRPTTTALPTTAPPTTVAPPTTTKAAEPTAAEQATPDVPVDVPVDAVPAAGLPNLWVMQAGDHLWGVADAALSAHLGRPALNDEVDGYWRTLVALNRESLIDPDNPDLVFSGQVIELPPFT